MPWSHADPRSSVGKRGFSRAAWSSWCANTTGFGRHAAALARRRFGREDEENLLLGDGARNRC
jgi:hypothetical protein